MNAILTQTENGITVFVSSKPPCRMLCRRDVRAVNLKISFDKNTFEAVMNRCP